MADGDAAPDPACVADEIVNALAYFRLTFIAELPRLYADLEEALRASSASREPWLPPFLTVGTWVGGDRDGNPNVGASTLEIATVQQARLVLGHYLGGGVNLLGRELSLAGRLMRTPGEVLQLAERSRDTSAYRRDEPYRRVVSGSTAGSPPPRRRLVGVNASPPPMAELAPYPSPAELAADLELIARGLEAQGAGALAEGRLRACGAR